MKKTVISLILIAVLFSGCSLHDNNPDKIPSGSNSISSDVRIMLEKSAKEIKHGEVSSAIRDLTNLTSLHPKLAIGYYNLGIAYISDNRVPEAIKAWEKTVTLDDKYADAYFNLGKAYKTVNKQKARENLLKYLLLRPNDPYINVIKDQIYKLKEPVIGKGIVGRISMTDEVDTKNNIALSNKDFFKPDTPVIYSCIELVNSTKDKNIEVDWFFIAQNNDKIPVNKVNFLAQGSKNIIVSLKKPYTEWPSGKYEEVILINGVQNVVVPFIIQR